MENNRWDDFAKKNPEYYILTKDVDYSTKEGKRIFFKSGKEFTNKTLEKVSHLLPDKKRALEIGCGIGRLTLPHANHFDEVIAVDIAPTMLTKLQENAAKFGHENIQTYVSSEQWWQFKVSYAYSYLVFQHIQDFGTIEKYINKIAYCLECGGIAQLQFDTRNANLLYNIRNWIPDFLLPRPQRKGIRRIRRSIKVLKSKIKEAGLKIVDEYNRQSATHIFVLEKQK